MNIFSIITIAFGLSADAFSLAAAKGVAMCEIKKTEAFKIAFMFGLFQFLMPCVGFYAAGGFFKVLVHFSDLAAFFILAVIGAQTLYNAQGGRQQACIKTNIAALIMPSAAVSLDALAVGLTLSAFEDEILPQAVIIGLIAFFMSLVGVYAGRKFGEASGRYGGIFGGMLLILLSLKFLVSFAV